MNMDVRIYDGLLNFDVTRSDLMVQRKDISIIKDDDSLMMNIEGFLFGTRMPTKFAMSQFCKMIKVPYYYISRCPADLSIDNLMYWNSKIRENPKIKMCSLGKDRVIGVLTMRHKEYKHTDIFTDINTTIIDSGNQLRYDNYQLTNECLDINGTFENMYVKDEYSSGNIHVGLHIRNSEVGYSAASTTAVIINGDIVIPVDTHIKDSSIWYMHTGDVRDKFHSAIGKMVAFLHDNSSKILGMYNGTGECTLTVKDIREIIDESSLPKNIVDDEVGFTVFGKDVDLTKKLSLREVIDAIGRAASKRKYPDRWEIERVNGKLFSRYESLPL
jgi:hypothetical protein